MAFDQVYVGEGSIPYLHSFDPVLSDASGFHRGCYVQFPQRNAHLTSSVIRESSVEEV